MTVRPLRVPCAHCGLNTSVRFVRVRPVREPAARASRLPLCERCLGGDDRTWRLRWALAPAVK